nr:MAG TPA: hypothetical protein [Caudoviricetes sp.]
MNETHPLASQAQPLDKLQRLMLMLRRTIPPSGAGALAVRKKGGRIWPERY